MDKKEKWLAVANNDKAFDGVFYYAVKSTRIFCRPSCPSRTPLEENVEFFETAQDAMDAGYRPCKRCRPDLINYQPALQFAQEIKTVIDAHLFDKQALASALAQMGVSRRHMTEIFANQYAQTPLEYLNARRLEMAKTQLLASGVQVLDVALSLGFESLSAFYTFFKKNTGVTPGEFKKLHKTAVNGNYYTYDLALGKIAVAAQGDGIVAVQFAQGFENYGALQSSVATDSAARQLEEYFAGKRKNFELPLKAAGTPFQQKVWEALAYIPYGQTRSYGQVAQMIASPGAARAVGMANNKNPLLIVVPCHRVVGAGGALVGYAAGLQTKKQLLELEQRNI